MRRFPKKTGMPARRGTAPKRKRFDKPTVPTGIAQQVRSKHEKVCVEFLEAHQIKFIYEPLLLLSGRQFRPDFYLPARGVFLEICGFTHMPYYRDRQEEKTRIYKAQGIEAIFLEVGPGKSLKKQLERLLLDHPNVD